MPFRGPRLVLTSILALSLSGGAAFAQQSLDDALVQAYHNNPQLQAERARQRALDEDVARALGGFRPSISVTGEIGAARDRFEAPGRTTTQRRDPRQIALQLRQPLYDGGRSIADLDRSELAVLRGRAALQAAEQSVLFEVVTAYYDLHRDRAIAELTRSNVEGLERQVDVATRRYRVNDVTVTDVVQAEARLARGISERTFADGNLGNSRSAYERVVGSFPPEELTPPPTPRASLPGSLAEVRDAADQHPALEAARFAERMAKAEVDIASSALRPDVSIRAGTRWISDTDQPNLSRRTEEVVLQVTVPLYEGGVAYARTRGAKHTVAQRAQELETERRRINDMAQRMWEDLVNARSRIVALEKQVVATETAVHAVSQEVRVGARSLLDQLNADQELFEAQVALVRAQRDEAVAAYGLLVVSGRLTAAALNLDTELYQPEEHYDRARGRFIGTGIEEP